MSHKIEAALSVALHGALFTLRIGFALEVTTSSVCGLGDGVEEPLLEL